MTDVKMITIPEHRYKQLLEDSKILNALYAGGVDNWEWYSEALQEAGVYDEEEEE